MNVIHMWYSIGGVNRNDARSDRQNVTCRAIITKGIVNDRTVIILDVVDRLLHNGASSAKRVCSSFF